MDDAFILFLICLVFIFLIRQWFRKIHNRFDALTAEIQRLKAAATNPAKADQAPSMSEVLFELKQIRLALNALQASPGQTAAPNRPVTPTPELVKPVFQPVVPPENIPSPAPVDEFLKTSVTAKLATPSPAVIVSQDSVSVPAAPILAAATPPPPAPGPGFMQRFLQNNPDLEKFIGENLINKIGIAILVLGIGYFVKFAIDKDWINEIGRVFIGILAGGLLIGLAHRLRHTLSAFSSVLVGGGLAVLYFTVAIAFHEYQLFSQTAAFLVMVIITGFSILLSVSYNRVELAVVSLIGGFATPFMLSTGEGNYQVLFIYILILNLGMLVLAYLKGWRIINWVAYIFTVLLYGGWLSTRVLNVTGPAPYTGALFFGALFYLIFFLMNIVNNLRQKTAFAASEVSILLSNTLLFYATGMAVLAPIQGGIFQGLFTILLAVFNFGFAFALYRNARVDRILIYLLLGLVITFISLAIPVQLEGNYVTMFWALEVVLLWWLGLKSGLKFVFLSSVTVLGLMLCSLAMDWWAIYLNYSVKAAPLPVILNKGFITSLLAIISLTVTWQLVKKPANPITFRYLTINPMQYRRIVGFALGAVVYLALLLELNYQLNRFVPDGLSHSVIIFCYHLAYILGLLWLARYQANQPLVTGATWLGMAGVVLYGLIEIPQVYWLLRAFMLEGQKNIVGFGFHYVGLMLVLLIMVYLYQNRFVFARNQAKVPKVFLWLACSMLVYVASSELLYHTIFFRFAPLTPAALHQPALVPAAYDQFAALIRQTNKVGFPILWGICAFGFMYIGLRQKNKDLRIFSLTLFMVTLIKLFAYDIQGISEGGKIAAFISLGGLLLVISFMYQNIKRLILTDETTTASNQNTE